jgi:prepilin-type N-terminal cleavage/methylation domain-containing protein
MKREGFSLIELLVAMSVSLVLASMMLHLFHQNERVIRDQTLVTEMQQTARIVASQIADEVRMAGQGLPNYAAGFDSVPGEAVVAIMGSSNSNRIDFRAGLSNVETASITAGATDFNIGAAKTVQVATSAGFLPAKTAYLFGPTTNSTWTWLRGDVTSVSSTALTIIPRNTGSAAALIHFEAPPTIALEEAVSIYLISGSVRRAAASNLSNPLSPVWAAANELGKNVTALTFTYYDASGVTIAPTSLANRMAIARVRILLTVEVADRLSNGSRPRYSVEVQTFPRNFRLRAGPM